MGLPHFSLYFLEYLIIRWYIVQRILNRIKIRKRSNHHSLLSYDIILPLTKYTA